MPEKLLKYFARERQRLNEAFASARSRGDVSEIHLLERLRAITEDQLACWAAELAPDLSGPGRTLSA